MHARSTAGLAVVLAALVAVTLTPGALALEGSLTVDAAPVVNPVTPLTKRTVDVTIRVECEGSLVPGSGGNEGNLTVRVANAPEWLDASVDPALVQVSENQCRAGPVERVSRLTVSPSTRAPAFAEGEVVVEAVFRSPSGSLSGSDAVRVLVDWYSTVDAQVTEPIRVVEPNAAVSFPVSVKHYGNAPARLAFTVVDAADGWTVTPPDTFVLAASTGSFADTVSATVHVLLEQPPASAGYVNAPALFNLEIAATLASDPARAGDSAPATLLVTVKGWEPAWLGGTAYGGVLLAVAGVVAGGVRYARARG